MGPRAYALTASDLMAMGQGPETIIVNTIDTAGNTSATTAHQVIVDTIAPGSPTFNAVANDNVVNQSEVSGLTIAGKAEQGSTVRISIAGVQRMATVDAQGNWAYGVTPADLKAMGRGAKTLSAQTIDQAGNVGETTVHTITISTNAPLLTPFALSNASDSGNKNDGITQFTSPTIDFTAQAGVDIALKIGSGEFLSIGKGTGLLQQHRLTELPQGTNVLTLRAVDAFGNVTTRTGSIKVDSFLPSLISTTFTGPNGATLPSSVKAGDSIRVVLALTEIVRVKGQPSIAITLAGQTYPGDLCVRLRN